MSLSKSNSVSSAAPVDATISKRDLNLVSKVESVNKSLEIPKITVGQIQKVLAEYLNLVSATSYLNAQEKKFLNALNLPDHTALLGGLAEIINEILVLGVVHSHDIPQLVLSASNLIHANIQASGLADVRPLNVLKFIMTSLIHNNLIPISSQQIEKAQAVLDNCFTMLEIVLPAKVKKTCLSVLLPCFK